MPTKRKRYKVTPKQKIRDVTLVGIEPKLIAEVIGYLELLVAYTEPAQTPAAKCIPKLKAIIGA